MVNNFKNAILRYNKYAKVVSGGNHILTKCPCGDGKKHNSTHLYIATQKDTPLLYHCKICDKSGIVDNELMMDLGIYDQNILTEAMLHNNKTLSLSINKKYSPTKIHNIKYTKIRVNDNTKRKLDYLNNRLGLSLTYDDLFDLKIVLNIKDLLDQNEITEYTRTDYILNELNNSFMGFLSSDNGFINMRNINGTNSKVKQLRKRYETYNIFGTYDNSKRFYIIPNIIDPSNVINIHISEGPFDILSVKENIIKTSENNIFCAAQGIGLYGVISYILKHFKLIRIGSINIWKDNDVANKYLRFKLNKLQTYGYDILVHSNKLGKDFGESIDKIDFITERLF